MEHVYALIASTASGPIISDFSTRDACVDAAKLIVKAGAINVTCLAKDCNPTTEYAYDKPSGNGWIRLQSFLPALPGGQATDVWFRIAPFKQEPEGFAVLPDQTVMSMTDEQKRVYARR